MKARLGLDSTLMWHCPGCGCGHGVPVQGKYAWGWNGSLSAPTVTPSVLVHAHDSSPPFKPQPRCHCFITNGQILFQADCGHALAGKIVDMEDEE